MTLKAALKELEASGFGVRNGPGVLERWEVLGIYPDRAAEPVDIETRDDGRYIVRRGRSGGLLYEWEARPFTWAGSSRAKAESA